MHAAASDTACVRSSRANLLSLALSSQWRRGDHFGAAATWRQLIPLFQWEEGLGEEVAAPSEMLQALSSPSVSPPSGGEGIVGFLSPPAQVRPVTQQVVQPVVGDQRVVQVDLHLQPRDDTLGRAAISVRIAGVSPTRDVPVIVPSKTLPVGAIAARRVPTSASPRACRRARRAEVPVPVGQRQITFGWP